MKYIIEHRYKTIHGLYTALTHVISAYDMGRTSDFTRSFGTLLDIYPQLGWMMSPPSLDKEILILKKIEEELYLFLQLPDNFSEMGKDLISKCKELLYSLDPFTFSFDEPIGIRKSQIVEYARDLQIFIQTNLLSLEGEASSLIDEIGFITNIINDIKRMKSDDFERIEKEELQMLLEFGDAHIARPTIEKGNYFFDQALKVEKIFRGLVNIDKNNDDEYTLNLITTLLEVFEGEKTISAEPVILSLIEELNNIPLEGARDDFRKQAIASYKYALLEDFIHYLTELKNTF